MNAAQATALYYQKLSAQFYIHARDYAEAGELDMAAVYQRAAANYSRAARRAMGVE